MAELLRQFEQDITDHEGQAYSVSLFGRSRSGDTWQGWLMFERKSDGRRFATGVETTQSDAEGLVYWAGGLGSAYFEGALWRAVSREHPKPKPLPAAKPVVASGTDAASRAERVGAIEKDIIDLFRRTDQTHLLTSAVLDALSYAHADTVRAIEDLAKNQRVLVRRTEQGNDWLFLTVTGMAVAGLKERPHSADHDQT